MKKNIAITGASSGIGAELARQYAKQPCRLLLIARNQERLEKVAEICRQQGAAVETATIDICDADRLKEWLQTQDKQHPIDLLIANAGSSQTQIQQSVDHAFDAESRLIDVHLHGTLNTIHAVLPAMQARKKGQIAIMSSISAFIAVPRTAAYGAVKAALLQYGLALSNKVLQDNIKINVICPGWVKTPLTDLHKYKMPFRLSVEDAAKKIIKGLEKNKSVNVFPWQLALVVKFIASLPRSWQLKMLKDHQ